MRNDQPLLEAYLRETCSPEHPFLAQLSRATHLHLLRPEMVSGHEQGVLLRILCALVKPRRILEIGTFSGYSALAMASACGPETEIHTIEANDEQEDFTRSWFERSPFAPALHLHIGKAQDVIPTLGSGFQMCYIDANKREYVDYYELILPLMPTGGILLADNTLWDGHVVDPAYENDVQTRAIRHFNAHVAADPRTEQIILPLRDGVSLIRKI